MHNMTYKNIAMNREHFKVCWRLIIMFCYFHHGKCFSCFTTIITNL